MTSSLPRFIKVPRQSGERRTSFDHNARRHAKAASVKRKGFCISKLIQVDQGERLTSHGVKTLCSCEWTTHMLDPDIMRALCVDNPQRSHGLGLRISTAMVYIDTAHPKVARVVALPKRGWERERGV